jgi:hypothetical protein
MKRRLITIILGIAATACMVNSSPGQGSVWFDNYNNANVNGPGGYSSPIYLDPGVLLPVGYSVDLYYALGTATDPNPAYEYAHIGTTPILTRNIAMPGYISAVVATIPNYVSGPISFQLFAYPTAIGAYIGKSQVLTLPSIATGTTLPGYLDGLQSFTLVYIPEPTAFALGCVAVGAFVINRAQRRSQLAKETVSRSTKGNL